MCGLAGILSYSPQAALVNQDELLRIREHMITRGPDGAGVWMSDDRRIGLAHRRLSIIDLSPTGAQPMPDPETGLQIVFNGEIYNYPQLRAGLEAAGHVFRSHSDTEVLLKLYLQHGRKMLTMLRGMFSFALWDSRQSTLLLARDPYGIKPLYYADNGDTIRFASTVKSLLAGGQIDTRPEPAGHVGFFLWGSVPEPWTLYAGIRALPAGHFMLIGPRGVEQPQSYVSITEILHLAALAPAKGSREQALEAIADALQNTVDAHLIADVPVGMFLSAGLDSALITTLACERNRHPQTLTLSFAEYANTHNDEAPLAQSLADLLGTRHSTVQVSRETFQTEVAELLSAMDQPSIDGVNTWFVSKAAHRLGMKVVLSGVGGDELFASYGSFQKIPGLLKLTQPLACVPGVGKSWRRLAGAICKGIGNPKYASVLEYGADIGRAYFLVRSLHQHWELPEQLEASIVREGWQKLQHWAKLKETTTPLYDQQHKNQGDATQNRFAITALESSWYMRNQLLRDADWASMAHSLELRTPLVDVQLLRSVSPWVAAYPDIKKAEAFAFAARSLPSSFLHKPKTGFSIPVREWMLAGQKSNKKLKHGLFDWADHVYQASNACEVSG